jgi:hypothetical protein
MADTSYIDARYYEAVPPRSISERVAVAARTRIYADFLRVCRPERNDAILDVGVSDVVNDAANMLEQQYPHPEKLTAVGLGRPDAFRKAYPAVDYHQVLANESLAFADKSFAVAMSNAVLEHVGSVDNQRFFVSELCRVARRVFISVPHRYFPVEHHTGIPLLHYWRGSFAPACRLLGKGQWADQHNLILMSRRHLLSLAPAGSRAMAAYTGIKLGWASSNLFLYVESPAHGGA